MTATPSITRHVTQEGREERALDKARAAKHKAWLGYPGAINYYKVHSFTQAGVWYALRVTQHGIECNCAAGQAKQPCKHAALLSLRLRREHKPNVLVEWFHDTLDEASENWWEDIPELPQPDELQPATPTKTFTPKPTLGG